MLQLSDDGNPALGPALALRLIEFGVVLPIVDDLSDLSAAKVLDEVRTAVSAKRGWTIREAAVQSAFSFMREAMYRDQLANEVHFVPHPPPVGALANQSPTSQDGSLLYDEIRPEHSDRDVPPESIMHYLAWRTTKSCTSPATESTRSNQLSASTTLAVTCS